MRDRERERKENEKGRWCGWCLLFKKGGEGETKGRKRKERERKSRLCELEMLERIQACEPSISMLQC